MTEEIYEIISEEAEVESEVVPVVPTFDSSSFEPTLEGEVYSTLESPSPSAQIAPAVPAFDVTTLGFISLAIAVLAVAVLTLLSKGKKARGSSLLLVGPPDAGKTAILSALVYKEALPTHTSLQVNSSVASIRGEEVKKIGIVDVPGHPRIREQFKEHLSDAKAIAFVVDSNTVSRNGAAVAEHLHLILHSMVSLPPSRALPSLVIVAHKCDLLKTSAADQGTFAVNRVKSVLERELEKRRASQSTAFGVEGLGGGAEEDERSDMSGLECGGGTFRFGAWDGGEIGFVGTSVRTVGDEKGDGVGGLGALEDWIADIL